MGFSKYILVYSLNGDSTDSPYQIEKFDFLEDARAQALRIEAHPTAVYERIATTTVRRVVTYAAEPMVEDGDER